MKCDNEKCDRWCNEYDNNCCEFPQDNLPQICRFFLTNETAPVADVPCNDGLSGVLNILNSLIKEFETDPCFTSEEQEHIDSKIRGVEEAVDRINRVFKETT